jgi:hypothetical protein
VKSDARVSQPELVTLVPTLRNGGLADLACGRVWVSFQAESAVSQL